MRRVIPLLFDIVGLGFLSCIGVLASPMLLNNYLLRQQSAELDALVLPATAREVGRHDEFGLQHCCSNHCDFFTGRALEIPTDVEALRATLPEDYGLVHPDEVDAALLEIRGFEMLFEQTPPSPDRYFLYRYVSTYEGWGANDPRCH